MVSKIIHGRIIVKDRNSGNLQAPYGVIITILWECKLHAADYLPRIMLHLATL